MLALPHAVTAGASLYNEQENLVSQSMLYLISILLTFRAITLERSVFKENPTSILTSIAR